MSLTGRLNLVAVVEKLQTQAGAEQGSLCPPKPSPPPLDSSEMILLWVRLPAANRHRLLWWLSQRLKHQLITSAAKGEAGDEPAPWN
jgi:hypothetical protein